MRITLSRIQEALGLRQRPVAKAPTTPHIDFGLTTKADAMGLDEDYISLFGPLDQESTWSLAIKTFKVNHVGYLSPQALQVAIRIAQAQGHNCAAKGIETLLLTAGSAWLANLETREEG